MNRYSILSIFICLLMTYGHGVAGEYQWSVKARGYISPETDANPEAFLWIPQDCQYVRAIVVGQHNMCEETIFNNEKFRRTMSELGFAIVWITPGINYEWDVKSGCQEVFDNLLNDLAEVSGYDEIKNAPIVPLGHSAMATSVWNFAAWNPGRTLAVVSYKGDAPRTNLTGYGRGNLEWGRTRNIDGIPGLMIEGEYEWWEARVNPALAFRMMYPESCISFLGDVGHGHFDAFDPVVDYITLFLKKAAVYRLDENKPGELKKINPREGWLAQRWSPDGKKRPETAPFVQYKGNPHDAFWYFDEDMARATERYYTSKTGKNTAYIGYMQQGKLLPFNEASHVRYSLPFKPTQDGLTFNLSAVFTDSLHRSKVLHRSNDPISIHVINGPVQKINDTTFRIQFYRMGLENKRRTNEITLVACHPGNSAYKSAVQEIGMKIPYPLTAGKRQHIFFPGLQDKTANAAPVELSAISDSGLPVFYYVKEGPAIIQGNKLALTKIPSRAKYPVKVTVVAWQYGLQGEVQTAEAVKRIFYITK